MMVDPVSLRLFLAAVETGSLTKAAARECTVPSAVSKRMSDLEAQFGVVLFDRDLKGVRPTPAGEALAVHARAVLQDMDRLHQDMAGFATGVRGHVRLLASVAALTGDLPADIQSFRASHPQIGFTLLEATTLSAFEQVLEGQGDLAVGSDFGVPPGLQSFPYGSCPLAAITPQRHRLADHDALSARQLADFEQIELIRDNGINRILDAAARDAGIARRVSARVGSHETICMLVERGLGVGIVPMYLKGRQLPGAGPRFHPLTGPFASPRLCIVAREADTLSSAAQAFLDHLQSRR